MPSALDDDRTGRDVFIAQAGDTVFAPTRKCVPTSVLVILNGALLTDRSAYTVSANGVVTLAVPRYQDETVDLVYTLG